jgi:hypothetical protein
MDHAQRLVELIQYNARLQANIEILSDFLDYIDSSEIEWDLKDISHFIQAKIRSVMKFRFCPATRFQVVGTGRASTLR